jgi:hypothetical protein
MLGRFDRVAGFDGAACAALLTLKRHEASSWAPQRRRLSHGVSSAAWKSFLQKSPLLLLRFNGVPAVLSSVRLIVSAFSQIDRDTSGSQRQELLMFDNYIIEIRPNSVGNTIQAGIVVRDGGGFRFFAAADVFNSLEGQLFKTPRAAESAALRCATHITSPKYFPTTHAAPR